MGRAGSYPVWPIQFQEATNMARKQYRHKPEGPKTRKYLRELYAFRDRVKKETKRK